jgi:hypothetical protein
MDIEGCETMALKTAETVWQNSPTWFIEFAPDQQKQVSGASGEELLSLFFERGYSATILHRDMRREPAAQSAHLLMLRWGDYMRRNITHLDLMMAQGR